MEAVLHQQVLEDPQEEVHLQAVQEVGVQEVGDQDVEVLLQEVVELLQAVVALLQELVALFQELVALLQELVDLHPVVVVVLPQELEVGLHNNLVAVPWPDIVLPQQVFLPP